MQTGKPVNSKILMLYRPEKVVFHVVVSEVKVCCLVLVCVLGAELMYLPRISVCMLGCN